MRNVVPAHSYAAVEAAARSPATKGVYWDRGPHPLQKGMTQWVHMQDESREALAQEQLHVSVHGGDGETAGGCGG